MKLLHTSDWHLGQNFMGKSRKEEHKQFLSWLKKIIQTEGIDVLIVSGDIFDTGAPPSYAQKLYFNNFLMEIRPHLKKIIVIGGNHDSVAFLNATKALLKSFDIDIIAGDEKPEDCIIALEWEQKLHGVVCAVPYLRDSVLRKEVASTTEEKEKASQKALAKFYEEVHKLAKEKIQDKNIPIIATGHLTLQGVDLVDGEREVYIGGEKAITPKIFQPFDYVALGHIHRYKKIDENIYYSGSPLYLSFSEIHEPKKVQIVEFEGKTPKISSIELPIFRRLVKIEGSSEEVLERLEEIKREYKQEPMSIWVEVWLQDGKYVDKIREKTKESNVEILAIRLKKEDAALMQEEMGIEELSEQNVQEIFEKRLQDAKIEEDSAKLKELFAKIVEEVRGDENTQN